MCSASGAMIRIPPVFSDVLIYCSAYNASPSATASAALTSPVTIFGIPSKVGTRHSPLKLEVELSPLR